MWLGPICNTKGLRANPLFKQMTVQPEENQALNKAQGQKSRVNFAPAFFLEKKVFILRLFCPLERLKAE